MVDFKHREVGTILEPIRPIGLEIGDEVKVRVVLDGFRAVVVEEGEEGGDGFGTTYGT